MSAPPAALPVEIAELMTVTTVVQWQQSLTTDINGQWTYASPVALTCWFEGEGMGINAGITNSRANFNQQILQQTRRPEVDMYFDGSDSNAQSFKMTDLFTLSLTGFEGMGLMPSILQTFYGPPFDNYAPWLILASF